LLGIYETILNTHEFNLRYKKIYLDLHKQKNYYFLQARRCRTLNLQGKYRKINGGRRGPPKAGHWKVK